MSEKKSKNILKEKFVSIYEAFFKAEDFSTKPANFWDDLFLLKVNSNYIVNEFKSLSTNEDLIKLKKNINYLYNKAIEYLGFETNPIRLHNIVHTLYLFTYSITITKRLNCIETLEFLVGIDNADLKFQTIFYAVYTILTNEETSNAIKKITFKYLLSLASQVENVNDNLFIEHFMVNNSLFEAIIQTVSDSTGRALFGRDALLLLTILLQYKKYDAENPFIVKLSILDDEMALTGLAQVMSSSLAEYNRNYANSRREQEGESSWWNNVGTMIGNMFIGDEDRRRLLLPDDSILLILYECVHLNRNFISTLTHAATEFSNDVTTSQTSINSDVSRLSSSSSVAELSNATFNGNNNSANITSTSLVDTNNMRLLSPLSAANLNSGSVSNVSPTTGQTEDVNTLSNLSGSPLQIDPPSNLLVIFLQSCSSILQDTKMDNPTLYDTTKLFMLILVCISEDQYANSLLHDSNILYSVFLYQAKLRHRKLNPDKVPQSRQLACSVLDLMIEFMQSHLMKNFPFELYLKTVGIIQRLMCYQKKYRIRLDYNWQNLWICLINTLKFVISCDSMLLAKGHNLFMLYSKIVIIFNIFITFGDTFLPNPESYDYLYYDLMRMRQVFDNFLLLLNKYASSNEWKEHAIKLMSQMSNIKSIVNHFTPKIDAWSTANHVASLTEQQVLDIVRSNYESLTLKLEEDLDQYDRYSESNEIVYFSNLNRHIVNGTRADLSDLSKLTSFNQQNIN